MIRDVFLQGDIEVVGQGVQLFIHLFFIKPMMPNTRKQRPATILRVKLRYILVILRISFLG